MSDRGQAGIEKGYTIGRLAQWDMPYRYGFDDTKQQWFMDLNDDFNKSNPNKVYFKNDLNELRNIGLESPTDPNFDGGSAWRNEGTKNFQNFIISDPTKFKNYLDTGFNQNFNYNSYSTGQQNQYNNYMAQQNQQKTISPSPIQQQKSVPQVIPQVTYKSTQNKIDPYDNPANLTNGQALRDVAKGYGYRVEYDQPTNTVKVFNDANNKYIQFKSGKGLNYGIGSFKDGTNYIADTNKFLSYLGDTVPVQQQNAQPVIDTNNVVQTDNTNNVVQTNAGTGVFPDGLRNAMNVVGVTSLDVGQPDRAEQTKLIKTLNDYQPANRQEILNLIRAGINNPYKYDPNTDPLLKNAMSFAERQVMESANRRGIANSTITGDNLRAAYGDLTAQYDKIAYGRYQDELANKFKQADYLNSLDATDYERYKTYVDYQLNNLNEIDAQALQRTKDNLATMWKVYDAQIAEEERKISDKKEKLTQAYDKIDYLGYVDNQTSIITGLPVGTLSKTIQAEMRKQMDWIEQQQIGLEKFKSEKQAELNKTISETEYKQQQANDKAQLKAEAQAQLGDIQGVVYQRSSQAGWEQAIKEFVDSLPQLKQSAIEVYAGEQLQEYMQGLAELLTDFYTKKVEQDKTEQQKLKDQRQYEIDLGQLSVSRQNANTSSMNAETSRINTNLRSQELDRTKSNDIDKVVNEYSKYIEDVYMKNQSSKNEETGETQSKKVMSEQDKQDISDYLNNLEKEGESSDVVKKLAKKYNLGYE